MKTIRILLAIAILFFTFSNTKAQDDPNVGFYVDGVKVTELTCYSFGNLTVVLPYNSGYDNYHQFILAFTVKETEDPKEYITTVDYTISKSKITSSVKGKYIVLDILSPSIQVSELEKVKSMGPVDCRKGLSRGMIGYTANKAPKEKLAVTLSGQTQTSTKEEYDANCSCIKKLPVYSSEKLTKISLPLANQTKKTGRKEPCIMEIDLSQACSVPGNKVDFSTLK